MAMIEGLRRFCHCQMAEKDSSADCAHIPSIIDKNDEHPRGASAVDFQTDCEYFIAQFRWFLSNVSGVLRHLTMREESDNHHEAAHGG
jgi:hypothetical protein